MSYFKYRTISTFAKGISKMLWINKPVIIVVMTVVGW